MEELSMSLWMVDFYNPHTDYADCIIVEAESKEEAEEYAIKELKLLKIPKRYIVNMEEF